MKNINIIKLLKEQGLISQITNETELINISSSQMISVYCGFDPTADSLHLGHLMLLLCLKYFQIHGHRPIILIGGATGLIGDPSFKKHERKLNTKESIEHFIQKIKKQISLFLDLNCGTNSAIIVNNYNWFNSMNILDFLRKIGKFFSINKMLSKESIKQRLHNKYNGISFTEFSYSLLQSYDFAYLNQKYNVILQIGGSDQWGNIVSGINLIKRIYQYNVYGFTIPLITNSNNIKFGKTEKNTIWLDSNKTSPFKFYQFWLNIPDEEIYRFFKFLALIDDNVVHKLKEKKQNKIKIKEIKILIADKMTIFVHGHTKLIEAKRITSILFNKDSFSKLKEKDLFQLIKDGIPTIYLKNNEQNNLLQILITSKFAFSKKQARTLIKSRAITINDKKQTETKYIFRNSDKLFGQFSILKKGKQHYSIIYWS